MAKKKGKPKSGSSKAAKGKAPGFGSSPLDMLQDVLSEMPEEVRMNLLSTLMGGPPGDFMMPAREKPRTKALRDIDSLVEKAREQATPSEALPLLVRAEAAARKAVGKRFEALAGSMGSTPAGQTYLGVALELSQALAATGQRAKALEIAEEVFRLDPEDPEDARVVVLAAYFDLERLDDAEELLNEHCSELWAAWNFGDLLISLRRGQRGAEVDEKLNLAHEHNPYVLSLLLNERMLDALAADFLETGEDSEAQDYAAHFLPAWKDTPGAISWLREAAMRLNLEILPPDPEQPSVRPLSAKEYATLPAHEHTTWIAGIHHMGQVQMAGKERPENHWLMFAFSTDHDLIGFDFDTSPPSAARLWESLVEFMQDERQPGRPAELLIHRAIHLPQLTKLAARAKIAVEPLANTDQLEGLLDQLVDRMVGGAATMQAIDPELIRNAPLDVDAVWEAAVVQLDRQMSIAGHSLRPWVALVMSRPSGMILWHELFTETPPEGALANAIRIAIARPTAGPPLRPRQVIVRDHDEAVSLRQLADEAGFDCLAAGELPCIADAIKQLTHEFLGGGPEVVLTKSEGITNADLEQFYTAAATYFRAQPWKRFGMDEVIGLDVAGANVGPRFALAMGQSGITIGLAIYQRLQDIEKMFAARSEALVFDSFSVMFGEVASISPVDLDAIEQFGWPIATPEAYPDAMRIYPGPRVETPTAEGIRFLAASLEAITRLAQNRDQKSTTITTAGATLTATRLGTVGSI